MDRANQSFDLNFKSASGLISGFFDAPDGTKTHLYIDLKQTSEMSASLGNQTVQSVVLPEIERVLVFTAIQAGHLVFQY